MVDPVVSSKYGKRPLLEVPAMQVESGTRIEVSSLQERPKLDYPAFVYRPEGVAAPPQAIMPPPQLGVTGGMALPGAPNLGQGLPGSLFALPPPALPFQRFPNPLLNQPPAMQLPAQQFVDASGNLIATPTAYPSPVSAAYPGLQAPYQGQAYFVPTGAPPAAVPAHYPQQLLYPQSQSHNENFRLEGVLEYGQLTTVHFRDKTSNFHGLPNLLREELQKTYGKFPVTDVRIVAQNGEYHIYATQRSEGDEFVEGTYAGSGNRMIGFNEVRGDVR